MMPRRLAALGVVVALTIGLGVAFGLLTRQQVSASTTLLTVIDGAAEVASGGDFAAATDGQVLRIGDQVRTAAQSHAVITFFDGSTIELEPNTTVRVEGAGTQDGAILIRIQQTLGRTWSSVHRFVDPRSRYEVRTPSGVAAVRGTGFVTSVDAAGGTIVEATDGVVAVQAQGEEVLVTAGTRTTVTSGSPPPRPVPVPPPANRLVFGMHSPAYLAILDPIGRACGVVLPGPSVVRQIPECLADGPADAEPRRVSIPNAIGGTYRIFAFGIDDGPITVQAAAYSGSLLAANVDASTTIADGERKGASLAFDPVTTAFVLGFSSFETFAAPPLKVVLRSSAPSAEPTRTSEAARLQPTLPPLEGETPPPSATASPTASPSATPEASASPAPTESPTRTASPTPTATPTPTPKPSPTPSPAPSASASPSPEPSPRASPSAEPPAAKYLIVTAPSKVIAGEPFDVAVVVYDQYQQIFPFDGRCVWGNLTDSLSPLACADFKGGQSITTGARIKEPLIGDRILISGAGLEHEVFIDVLPPTSSPTPSPSPSPSPTARTEESPTPTPTPTDATSTPTPTATPTPTPDPSKSA